MNSNKKLQFKISTVYYFQLLIHQLIWKMFWYLLHRFYLNSKRSTFTVLSFSDKEFRFELHALFVCISTKFGNHFAGEVIKNCSKSFSIFGWSHAIINLILFSKLLPFFTISVTEIAFITDEINTLFGDVLLKSFIDVIITFLECLKIGEVEYAYAAMSAFVITGSQCSEFLLSSCIPDLERVNFGTNINRVCFEIDSDGGGVIIGESAIGQSVEDGAFTDRLRTDKDNFECFDFHGLSWGLIFHYGFIWVIKRRNIYEFLFLVWKDYCINYINPWK